MGPNAFEVFRVANIYYQERLAAAEQQRRFAQDRAGQGPQRSLVTSVRHAVGVALIFVGRRIRGASWAEPEVSGGGAIDAAGAAR